jgi:cholesterol transport system auxiliary component
MNMSTRVCVVLLAALVIFLGGCSLPGKSAAVARQTYLLQDGKLPGPAPAAQARPCQSLRVSAPTAAPGFSTIRMVYTTQPPRLDYFARHEWADAPARMLATLMDARLDSSGLFGAVLSGSSDVRTGLRMDTELKSLQQDFSGGESTLRLQIKVSLIEVSSRSLLAAKTFSYAEPAGTDPPSGVAAAEKAVQQFLADLTAFVAEAISPMACATE